MRKKVNYEAPLNQVEGLLTQDYAMNWLIIKLLELRQLGGDMLSRFDTPSGFDYTGIAWYHLRLTIQGLNNIKEVPFTVDVPSEEAYKDDLWNFYDEVLEIVEGSEIDHEVGRKILLDTGSSIVVIWGERD